MVANVGIQDLEKQDDVLENGDYNLCLQSLRAYLFKAR